MKFIRILVQVDVAEGVVDWNTILQSRSMIILHPLSLSFHQKFCYNWNEFLFALVKNEFFFFKL